MKITVEYEKSFFSKLEQLPKNKVKKAISMSVNEALKKGRTEFKRKASGVYNMKQGEIQGFTKIKPVKPSSLKNGKLLVESRRLTVGGTHFKSRPSSYESTRGKKRRNIRKRKTKVKIKKTTGFIPFQGGFIANPSSVKGGNTMVWIRLREGRTPIAPVKTISAAQMLTNKEVKKHVEEQMEKKYMERLERQIDRQMDRIGGKS